MSRRMQARRVFLKIIASCCFLPSLLPAVMDNDIDVGPWIEFPQLRLPRTRRISLCLCQSGLSSCHDPTSSTGTRRRGWGSLGVLLVDSPWVLRRQGRASGHHATACWACRRDPCLAGSLPAEMDGGRETLEVEVDGLGCSWMMCVV